MRIFISALATVFSLPLFSQYIGDIEQKFHAQEEHGIHQNASRSQAPSAALVDVTHVNMHMDAEPNRQTIWGDVIISYKVREAIDTLWLDFDSSASMRISVVQDDFTLNNNHYREGNFLIIPLSKTHQPGIGHRVRIKYDGTPSGPDIRSYFRSDDKHVWTRSEPYGARYWWPCLMTLQDKIDSVDIYLAHPKQYTGVSNGLLQGVDSSRSQAISHWKHNYPMAFYLLAFAIGDYDHITQNLKWKTDSIKVENYLFKNDAWWAQQAKDPLEETFALFDSLFGAYPFRKEHYGHVQTNIGGGMEHQTMSHMYNLNQRLVAHELAHQWFGNMVTCGSWEDLWLNESFATYLTALTHEAEIGSIDWHGWKVSTTNYITGVNTGSVFPKDTLDFSVLFNSRLTYNKGAYVLHTLRSEIGDQAFFTGVKNFLYDTKTNHAFAVTDDLKRHLESASGMDLTEFFNDWYKGDGHPNIKVLYTLDADVLNFEITQTGSTTTSPLFDFALPIGVYNNGVRKDFKFRMSKPTELFAGSYAQLPDSIVIDPDYDVLIGKKEVIEGAHFNVGLDALESHLDVLIFPNPVKDKLHIKLNEYSLKGNETVCLIDSQQRVVKEQNIFSSDVVLDTEFLRAGLYFVEIKTTEGSSFAKVVKR